MAESRFPLWVILTIFVLFTADLFAATTMKWSDLTVTAEELGMEKKGTLFFARGEVNARKADLELRCDEAIYDQTEGWFKALGNVHFARGNVRLHCGFLVLYEKEQRGIARLQPLLIKDLVRDSFRKNPDGSVPRVFSKVGLSGVELEFFRDREELFARGQATAIEVPSFVEDEAILAGGKFLNRIDADLIEIYSESAKAIGRGEVRVLTEELVASGEKGIYLKDQNRLIMTGGATVYQTNHQSIPSTEDKINQVVGDKIVVFPETNQTIVIGTVKSKVFQSQTAGE